MPETPERYEKNKDGYVGYASESSFLNGAFSCDSRSQEHDQLSSKSRERGRVKDEDRESNRDEECDWYMDRERHKERGHHLGDNKNRSDRKTHGRDRVDEHDRHQSMCRFEDDDRNCRGHHHRQYFDGYDANDYGDHHYHDYDRIRDYDRESEGHHKHGFQSRSGDISRHRRRSRSRSRSKREFEQRHRHRSQSRSRDKSRHRPRYRSLSHSIKSKRISGFDMPPPVMMPNVAVPGHVPGTIPAVPGMLPNMFPVATGQVQLPILPLMPVQSMPQQATLHARRVYVGGLSATANELSVAIFFNQVMSAIGGNTAGPGDAVVNVYINSEKKYAFVEMRSVEEASNAMVLDGIMFEGAPVKVRRPSDYNLSLAAGLGSSQPNPNLNLVSVGLLLGSASILEGPDRIFVGGLPYFFTEAQVRELLESFGALRGFYLVKDRETGSSKGYAFCVYQDLSITDIACAALNGIKMGDKTLIVRRANLGTKQSKPEQENVLLQAQQQIAIQRFVLQMRSLPTKIVCLTEVVSGDELNDDEEYEEILDDMKGEGGKYGNLVNIVIPRPGFNGETTPGVGRVFLEYDDIEGSTKARLALHGRKFNGNRAVAVFYQENKYSKGEYDG